MVFWTVRECRLCSVSLRPTSIAYALLACTSEEDIGAFLDGFESNDGGRDRRNRVNPCARSSIVRFQTSRLLPDRMNFAGSNIPLSSLSTLPPPSVVISLLPLLSLYSVHPLSSPFAAERPPLAAKSILLPRQLVVIQLHQPLVLRLLILALVPPLLDPFARLLVVDQVLLPIFERGAAFQASAELADALLAGKLFPLGGRLGLGERLPPR